jgi:hypothetical protein
MAQRSRFWDGTTIGDATVAPYDAGTEFSEVMTAVAGLTSDPNKGGLVSTLSVSMFAPGTMRIGAFEALVYGAWYQNDANIDIAVSTPATATRIDTVVLRKDWAAQTVRVLVITGTEGGSAPALVQTPGVTWDVPIATLSTTTGGTTTITPTNTRADFWYRTSPTAIRTNNNIGVGVNSTPDLSTGISVAKPGSSAPASYGQILDNRYDFGSNIGFDGTNWLRVDVAKPAFWADGNSVFPYTFYYAPAGANPIGAPYTSPIVTLSSVGTLTNYPVGAVRGLVTGDVTGGGQPAQQRYVSISSYAKSGSNANSGDTNIEFAAPNPNPMGIDFHVPNVAKWGGLYMHGAGQIYLGRDIGWGIPALHITPGGIMNFGFGRIRSDSGSSAFVDGQNGGYLFLGAGHNGGYAISVAPGGGHNTSHLGWGDRGWALVHSVSGLVQDSAVEAKTNIVALEPEAGMDAVRNTQPVRFAYKQPMTGPIKRDVTKPTNMKLLRDRLANYEKNKAFSTQHGFVLGSLDFPCDPLFETGKGQMNPANSVGVLIAALRYLDTYSKSLEARIAALEGA